MQAFGERRGPNFEFDNGDDDDDDEKNTRPSDAEGVNFDRRVPRMLDASFRGT